MRKKLYALCMCFSFLLGMGACGDTQKAEQLSEAEREAILSDALTFTLPLMMMDATFIKATNTVEATDVQAPVNQFIHAKNLATADFKDVVTPNVDTIYSQVFIDLGQDAVILEFPKTDRFCTVEIIDAFTNCVQIIDATQFTRDTERFLFTRENYSGTVPEDMTHIRIPSDLVWVLVRTICSGVEDLENVRAIQNRMDSYTLSQYINGTAAEKARGIFDAAHNFIPTNYVLSRSMQEYFERVNTLLLTNPPTAADQDMMERLKKINVGPGLKFDSSIFGADGEALWQELIANLVNKTTANSMQYIAKNGCWSFMGAPIAEFGTAYDYRALISLVGLGANPVSVAVYPKTTEDSAGGRLNGTNRYVLHFAADALPDVEDYGFWSITIYDSSNNLLIDNPLDRYCINDRSDVVFNGDGSLDILIQAEQPQDNVSNWLPTCEGEFHLVLRVYFPGEAVVNNSWKAPEIICVSEDS